MSRIAAVHTVSSAVHSLAVPVLCLSHRAQIGLLVSLIALTASVSVML